MKTKRLTAAQYYRTQGKNFMTPHVIGYFDLPKYLVELSDGRGIYQEKIFGVSVSSIEGERDHERSEMFYSRAEADSYINTLRGEY